MQQSYKELKHQQEEMKRSRIVETRKTYLVPLREHLVSWLAAINVSQGAMTQLTTADVTYFTPEQLAGCGKMGSLMEHQ
jgi:hypothetical protein